MSLFNSQTDVDVLINGKPVKKYSHNGKLFIEAKAGSEYTIKIRNGGWARKLFVAAVDGINAIDGEASDSSKNGYVINGLSTYDVKGFRVSNEKVNGFKFNKIDKSYAAKSDATGGDTSNVGVIGIQVYTEKEKPRPIIVKRKLVPDPIWIEEDYIPPYNPWKYQPFIWGGDTSDMTCGTLGGDSPQLGSMQGTLRCSSLNNQSSQPAVASFCCTVQDAGPEPKGFDLGTEFSDKEITDQVTEVEFETGYLETTIEIYYATRESLIEMGVPVEKETKVAFPTAFPSKFCKPPKK